VILRRDCEYSTSFVEPAANPISEGARWLGGLTYATDWSDVQTTSGRAFGTQSGVIGPPYNDSVAVFAPPPAGKSWGANQEVIGRVFITDRTGWASFKEVECLLRVVIAPGLIYLYEVLFSVVAGTTYVQIMRWNGPVGQSLGDFEEIAVDTGWSGLSHGTWVRGRIIGNVIDASTSTDGVNWAVILTGNIRTGAADGVYYPWAGAPGIGFWNREPTNGANNTFGFDYWTARNLP
jgi:hypothetical protein